MRVTTFSHNNVMTWKDFAEMTKAGICMEVGTKITDTLKDGTEFGAVLVHYRMHKDKNEAVFAFERCPFRCEMNDDYSNAGGYATKLRKKLAEFFDMLPDELQEVIKKKKIIQTMDDETHTFKDKLWIPSEYEVFGEEHWGKKEETDEQFEFFKEPINRVHRVEDERSACNWWLGSPGVGCATAFCVVGSAGSAGYGIATDSYGVLSCFLIR